MKLRSRGPKFGFPPDEAFDGLTAEEVRRIRGMGKATATPGLEGLAKLASAGRASGGPERRAQPSANKRGRRQ